MVHEGETFINPDPSVEMTREDELVLIGTYEAESLFLSEFVS